MASSLPRISVLLPVWNAAPFLATCLASIARQTEPDFECIVVDDGSTDASFELARRFAERDPRFRIYREPHEGLVSSLSKGSQLCRSPLVARMDADDWMRRDRLARQADLLDSNPELEAVGSHLRIFPRSEMKDGRRAYEEWLLQLSDPDSIWRERFIECPVAHPTLMIRKRSLEANPYRDRGWPEDYDLLLRLLRRGPVVGTVRERLLGWRDHPGRLSRTHADYRPDRFTECRSWHLSRNVLRDQSHYILWGHGPTGRALRKSLRALGHRPTTIVEVHPRRIGQVIHDAKVVPPETLRHLPRLPILVSVSGSGPRAEIRSCLESMAFREGFDFYFAA